MLKKLDNLYYLVGNNDILTNIDRVKCLPVFSEKIIYFFSELSKELLKIDNIREYQDIISYAYWIRKSSIIKEMEKHTDYNRRIGRGVSFHIAPSNVPINFVVSMTSALLAGNACVIRVSTKFYEQVNIICNAIDKVLNEKCNEIIPYICIIRYEHDDDITQYFSSICDIRIIWGGNNTINRIRKAALPPRSIEMAFADRYSIALINADEYLLMDENKVANLFYIDTYYTDQNACSSPRMVVWSGEKIEEAKAKFWKSMLDSVKDKYELQPIQAIDKYTSFCEVAAKYNNIKLKTFENIIYIIQLNEVIEDIFTYKNAGGYFFEVSIKELDEIKCLLGKQCQTISYLGYSEDNIRKFIFENGVKGVDRIVPIGKTMDLSFVWDGYDMVESMSRIVN